MLLYIIVKIHLEWLAILSHVQIKTDKFTDMDGIYAVEYGVILIFLYIHSSHI